MVFTRENTDQVTFNAYKNDIERMTFKELYAKNNAPSPDLLWGPSCETFKDCNDKTFG